jgi:Zn-dependent alcohol dehydrogenase
MAAKRDELPLDRFVTHRFPLERAEEAIRVSEADEALKVVFAPNRD